MNKLINTLLGSCLILTTLFPFGSLAAEDEFFIPRVNSEPGFEDFSGMRPASALARSMAKAENFIQRVPDNGDAATQRTEAYLAYDQEHLYVLFMAFDNEPQRIRANLSSRENIDGDDHVTVIIDTFNDQRAAFSFRSTPLGIQWDARWTEGASNRAGFDTTLEAVWDSEGQVTDQGYMVKMAIPLRSLRFSDSAEQVWRVQLGREIPRLNEESYWPAYSIEIEGRLNQTALMSGIENISPGRNMQIVPFMFLREADTLSQNAPGGPAFDRQSEQEIGVDAKIVFNDSMVLDVTLNPDFSQVESDEPQVTVNERFEVQYPERRPFFVENADFFATDSTLVFTRRIVDPEGGLRFTGRTGNYGFGTILINDKAPSQNRSLTDPLRGEKANISVLRGFRDISDQSRIGIMFTNRELGEGYNRVASLDGRFKLNDNWSTQLQFVGTESEPALGGNTTSGYQRNIQLNRVGRTLNIHSHFIETTRNFRTELGFQNRNFKSDVSGMHNRGALSFYPQGSVNKWTATLYDAYLKDLTDTMIYHQVQPSLNIEFDTTSIEFLYADNNEVLRPQDFPGVLTNTKYEYDYVGLGFENNTLNTVTLELAYQRGTALNLVPVAGSLPEVADSQRVDIDLLWRPIDRLRVSNTYLHTELETRNGGIKIFSNDILRSNWNYQFTREWSLRFIAQYTETDAGPGTRLSDDKNLNYDLLLRYVINPWSALYLGYNINQSNFEIVESGGLRNLVVVDDLHRDGDQIFVKFSYLFQR